MMSEQKVLFKVENGLEFTKPRKAIAKVDNNLCVNCGLCRRLCPTEAIEEYQRDICRLCPDCAEGPELFPEYSKEYTAQHSCSISCPLGTVPEGYINFIAEGKFDLAYEMIRDLNPLPIICSMICHHPCEDDCKRGLLIDKPIAIRALKRFITESTKPPIIKFNQKYDKSIAIIGAGPAGLTAAADLASKGYKVKIFEASSGPGGMMRKGIPNFRIDKQKLKNEIQTLLDAGIEIEYNCTIGKNPSIDDLLNKNYSAILIAVGLGKGSILQIPGTEAEKVYDALGLMRKINANIPVKLGKKAIIIGSGSVALDTARALRRLGVKDVTCACIESGDSLCAPKWEIQEALEEGIALMEAVCPTRVVTELFNIKGVEFKKVERIDTDEFGRLNPVVIDDENFVFDADTVVFATGQKPDIKVLLNNSKLKLNEAGQIIHDPDTYVTNIDNVFVAGDLISSRGSVIEAMASGRKAALAIDNMIMNREIDNRAIKRTLKTALPVDKIYPVRLENLNAQDIPKLRYRDSFEMVEEIFSEKSAILEAKRCMKCGFSGVNTENCIGCGVCVEVCPQKAITMVKA